MTRYLKLGATAGAVAGAALAVFLLAVGEGPMSDAIRLEEAAGGGGEAMVGRRAQLAGGALGAVLYGVLIGLVLGVVFAAVRHRLAFRDDWRRAGALAAVGFVSVSLVPALKYPANPPAVGDPDTVGRRTALYLVLLAWSVLSAWGAWRLLGSLAARGVAEPARQLAAIGAFALAAAAAFAVLPPSPDAVTAPATLVWRFRVASLGGALVFWGAAGAALGWLLLRSRRRPAGA